MNVATPAITLGSFLLIFAHASQAQPAIYRCEGDSGVIYSDRACGAGADPHEIDDSLVTVYTPEPIAERTSPRAPAKRPKASRSKASRSKTGKAADPAQHRIECARLHQGLRDVRTKMRSGYGAKEGERLKSRQRQLNEQRRAQKCG